MTYNIEARAKELWPNNEHNQQAWLNSIAYLRTQSKRGWLLDTEVKHKGR